MKKRILVCYVPKGIQYTKKLYDDLKLSLSESLKDEFHVIVVKSEVRDDWHFAILTEDIKL